MSSAPSWSSWALSTPDFADPRAEGDAIAAALPAGTGTAAMVDGAGHYPHAQCPDAVAELVIPSSRSTPVPRAGLARDDVARAAASLPGEIGYPAITIDLLAEHSASAHRPCASTACEAES
jgi:hypothetical protein